MVESARSPAPIRSSHSGANRADVFDAPAIADNFVEWRDQVVERPYFAMLNMLDAHAPYRTPFAGRFNKGRDTIDRYDGAIAFQDSVVGSLVARLAQRGELERTITSSSPTTGSSSVSTDASDTATRSIFRSCTCHCSYTRRRALP